ncbi:MAG TPA: 3'-5' exonuclease [Gemmatimonadaceae bacterium]|nr:3'-5' exonuclease [Gemmatimonadaceae bacterium]
MEFVTPETLLVRRARDYLAAGPATSRELASRVCQLPGAPAPIAEHMILELLGGRPEFARTADGRWALAAAAADCPAAASAAADRLDALSFVVVDVETTGGQPDSGDRVTGIAAVLVEGGRVVERPLVDTLVNPLRPIPPHITRLTNITSRMVATAPTFDRVCDSVVQALRGRVFVAHNASFDWRFVSAEVGRATGVELAGRRLCTVRLARKLLPQLPRRTLDYVSNHYGVPNAARHRALGDAMATAHVLLGLLRDAGDRGCATWAELETLVAASTGPRRRRPRSAMPRFMDSGESA